VLPSFGPSPALAAAVTAVKAVALLVLTCVVAIALATTSVDEPTHRPMTNDESPIAWNDDRLAEMMTEHRCSTTGFGNDHIPGSAIVLRDGEVRHVSFDHGWAVFTGKREGTLVAVCLDDR